jgi:hypothetical protein
MNVEIPEALFFDIVGLLVEPRALIPSEGRCILRMEDRDRIVGQLLDIQRQFLFGPSYEGADPACFP